MFESLINSTDIPNQPFSPILCLPNAQEYFVRGFGRYFRDVCADSRDSGVNFSFGAQGNESAIVMCNHEMIMAAARRRLCALCELDGSGHGMLTIYWVVEFAQWMEAGQK